MQEALDIKKAFSRTIEEDISQYGDFLALGKVFEVLGEKNAAAESYSAFVKNVIAYEDKKDGKNRLKTARLYGMDLSTVRLNSFSGPVEFVLGVYYICFLHDAVVRVLTDNMRRETNPKKAFSPRPSDKNAVDFLKWLKNTGSRSLQSIAAFERTVRAIGDSRRVCFASNMSGAEALSRFPSAFTDSVPSGRDVDFIFAL